jgi:prepilin-type processing-associated H-X9-DG protein
LIELLAVIGTLAVIILTLFPVLANTRPGSRNFACLNNTRRLTLAWLAYVADNSDLPIPTSFISSSPGSGSYMDWTTAPSNTNTVALLDPAVSPVAAYVQSVEIFKCPSDTYRSPTQSAAGMGPRARSYAFDLALGGRPDFSKQTFPGRSYISAVKISDLNTPGPGMVFVVLDEHADSINDGVFALDPGQGRGSEFWRDLPAAYHDGAANLGFADGHSETHKWLTIPQWPVTYSTSVPWKTSNLFANADYEWLDDRMPYR